MTHTAVRSRAEGPSHRFGSPRDRRRRASIQHRSNLPRRAENDQLGMAIALGRCAQCQQQVVPTGDLDFCFGPGDPQSV